MPVNASRVRQVYDGHASVVFRAPASAPVTADAYSSALALNELDAAYWQAGVPEMPYGYLVVAVLVEAIDLQAGAGAGEPIIMSLRVDDTANMSDTPVVVAEKHVVATGYFEFVVDMKSIPGFDPETSGLDKWMAVHVDLVTDGGNDDQTISYHAWMAAHRRG